MIEIGAMSNEKADRAFIHPIRSFLFWEFGVIRLFGSYMNINELETESILVWVI